MKKRLLTLLVAMVFVIGLFTGCTGTTNTDTSANANTNTNEGTKVEQKFAIILGTGGLGDQSFNDLTYEGMKKAEKELGITFDYVEPKEVADYETQQRAMADAAKYGLIVCVGFDQVDALTKVAADYPDQKFALIDSVVDAPNVVSFVSEEQEGSFLVGAMAGLMKLEMKDAKLSGKNVTGVVGALDIPLIRKFIAGYMAGVKYVNPDMEVVFDYVGDFSDPTTAKEIALNMNQKGADIIYHAAGGSGLGVFEAAKQGNFMAIGVNSNQNAIAPDNIFASMLKRVDVAAYESVKSVVDGTFKGGVKSLGLVQEGVGYSVEGSNIKVPEDIIKKVEELKKKIVAGEIKVPVDTPEVDAFLKANTGSK
ncbi:MAG: BMP family lipoprotein [Clostridia bacterium]